MPAPIKIEQHDRWLGGPDTDLYGNYADVGIANVDKQFSSDLNSSFLTTITKRICVREITKLLTILDFIEYIDYS